MHGKCHNPARNNRQNSYRAARQLDRTPIPKTPNYRVYFPILGAHLHVSNVAIEMECFDDERAIESAHVYIDERYDMGRKAVGRIAVNGDVELLIGDILERSLDCDAVNISEQLASASLGILVGKVAMREAGIPIDRR